MPLKFLSASAAILLLAAVVLSSPRNYPNFLLITIDTLRADHLGCYGYSKPTTPYIDKLAGRGIRFENAYAPAPLTLPSHATILSGLYPVKHGMRDNAHFRAPDQPFIAQTLKSQGYQTAAFVSGAPLHQSFGLDRGFDYYDDAFNGRERNAADTTDRALTWLQKNRQPYFLWIHYFDPHAEYEPPQPFTTRFSSNLYDGEIAFVDSQLDRLITSLQGNPYIFITADHGESLGEHSENTHGVFLYNATMRVPLILVGPGIIAAVRKEHVGLVDLAPTILDLAKTSGAPSDGVSLVRPAPSRILFLESLYAQRNFGYAPLFAAFDRGHKYIHAPRPELYDLLSDPREEKNVYSPNASAPLKRALEPYAKSATSSSHAALSSEESERLRSLGYIGGSMEAGSIDPKDRVFTIEKINTGLSFLMKAKYEQAEKVFQELVKTEQQNSLAFRFLADSLAAQKEYAGAVAAFSSSYALRADPEVAVQLAKSYNKLGELSKAEKILKDCLAGSSDFPQVAFELSSLYQTQQKWEPALQVLDRDVPEFHNQRGILYLNKKEPAFAIVHFRKALEKPKPTYWNNLGIAYEQSGQLAQAKDAFSNALQLDSQYEEAEANLAFLLIRLNQWSEALPHLQSVISRNPRAWQARFAEGFVLERQGKQNEALRLYQKLLNDVTSDWPQRSQLEARIQQLSN